MLSCVAEATHLQQELREFLPQFGIFGILADGFFKGLVGRLDEGPRVFGILGLFQQEPREFRVDLIVVGAEIEVTRKKLQSLVLSLLLDPEPGKRLVENLAGSYETGASPGDRRLEIASDGKIVWIKFGPDRSTAEKREMTSQAATTGGFDALFTSRKSIIKVRDRASLVLFGDTYVRVAK